MARNDIVVAGLGEVGQPLFKLIEQRFPAVGIDIEPQPPIGECAVLHVCYPFSKNFIATTVKYIEDYGPDLTIINSTVKPGTTREVFDITGTPLAYSPVRGKHARMQEDMLRYAKFIGGIDRQAGVAAAEHFKSIGLKTKSLPSPDSTRRRASGLRLRSRP